MNTWLRRAKYQIHFSICCHLTLTTIPQNFILWFGMLAGWLCSTYNDFNEEYFTQYHTPFQVVHGSGKLPWGHGLCTMCDQCRTTSYLSHPITGWILTWLTCRWPIIILLIGRHVTWPESVGWRFSEFYSSILDTAVHTGICETELLAIRGCYKIIEQVICDPCYCWCSVDTW